MKTRILTAVMSAAFLGLPALVGCDRTISRETEVKERNGKTTVTDKKVTEKSDGTIEKSTEKKTVDK